MDKRSTHQPVSPYMGRSAAAGTPARDNTNIAIGFILGGIMVGLIMALAIVAAGKLDPVHPVREGDRVCVSMLSEGGEVMPDAYYCGPVVLTSHDDIGG